MSAARSFEAVVMPLLDSAYQLARWLLRDDASAEDAVQEAALRAFRHFKGVRGDDARPWFLAIVRNVCFTQLALRKDRQDQTGLEDYELEALQLEAGISAAGPEGAAQRSRNKILVDCALRALPPILREVIVLRELEDMAYDAIATIVGIPIGTVMSRLSRARQQLKAILAKAGADY